MIKNLLNADEEPPEGTKVIIEDTVVNPAPGAPRNESPAVEETSPAAETRPTFEIPEDAKFFTKPAEIINETAPLDEDSESEAALMAELEKLSPEDLERLESEIETAPNLEPVAEPKVEAAPSAEAIPEPAAEPAEIEKTPPKIVENMPEPALFQSNYTPPSTGETIRQSGLAYSAAIVLFGSVIFMMIFGWFADLLLGSSPWGLVGGIILGGLIGFIQLFRITSQIFKK